MKRRPMIGITSGLLLETEGPFKGHWRSYVNDAYIKSIHDGGGTAVILPVTEAKDALVSAVSQLDGLLLSGGADVNPLLYGQQPEPLMEDLLIRRDAFERSVLQVAEACQIPVLGICRGLQMINVHYGGSLYQDLSRMDVKALKHSQGHSPEVGTHSLSVDPESFIGPLYGSKTLVNSFHHQGIKDLAPSFKACAWSEDGLIEAIESHGEPLILGLQWHPEMMSEKDLQTQMLFKKWIEYTASWTLKKPQISEALSVSLVTEDSYEEVSAFFETVLKDLYLREGFGWQMAETYHEELNAKRQALRHSLASKETLPLYYELRLRGILAGTFALTRPGNLIVDHVELLNMEGQAYKRNEAEKQVPELASFFILPELQGCGIGKEMLKISEVCLRTLGYRQYCLDCGYSISQRFWRKQLGEASFTLKDFWGPDAPHMIWQKNL